MSIISTELIARIATMKNATPEKVVALTHAIEYNSQMDHDRVCLYRSCFHHESSHNKTWIAADGKKVL